MKKNVIQPTYYDRFSCLGPDCRYTCCQEWRISLKKSEYTQICNLIHSQELESLFRRSFPRDKKDRESKAYANVSYDKNQKCRLLNEEGLCRLQLSCGHEALPKTCQDFPRLQSYIMDGVERQLSLGCEAVTGLMMEERNGIAFEQSEVPLNRIRPNKIFLPKESKDKRPALQYFWDIKTISAGILQERELSLEDRMIALGVILQKMDRSEVSGDIEDFPELINRILKMELKDMLPDNISELDPNPMVSISSAIFFLWSIGGGGGNKYLTEVVDKIYKALGSKGVKGIVGDETFNANAATMTLTLELPKYNSSKVRYQKWMEKYEYFLENLMVSSFFFLEIPFAEKEFGIWEHYLYFANLYNMYKVIILGVVNSLEDCDEDQLFSREMELEVIHAITVCARLLTHSFESKRTLIERAKANESDSLAHMTFLIKS